jgi:hypothetical protein
MLSVRPSAETHWFFQAEPSRRHPQASSGSGPPRIQTGLPRVCRSPSSRADGHPVSRGPYAGDEPVGRMGVRAGGLSGRARWTEVRCDGEPGGYSSAAMLFRELAARLAWAVAGAALRPHAGRIAALGVLIGLPLGVGVAHRSLAAHARAPSAPSHLTARADANAVNLRWRAPTRGRVTRYRIERGGRPIARIGGARRSYTDGRVRQGRTYRYAVRALGRAGTRSRASRAVRVTVPAPTAGALPTGASPLPVALVASPTGSLAPTADLPGWRHVFAEDFSVPTERFPGSVYAATWWAYPSGWTDTSGSVGGAAAAHGD